MQERLQKFLSGAGVASRRAAEKLITSGKVRVNGQVVTKLGTKVDPQADQVLVGGKPIKAAEALVYLALNKPKRHMTTRFDPERRKTIYDLLPAELKNKVWPVGRLDFNTEGLLLLTNDGDLTQKLTHPSSEHEKEYEVVLDREPTEEKLEKIRTGVFLDGKKTSKALVWAEGAVVYLTIHEGWKRQVRKMFSVLGYTVRNLKRIRIEKLKLSALQLQPGKFKAIDKKDIM